MVNQLLTTLEITCPSGGDIQLQLFTELEICDLIEEHSFVSDLQCPMCNVQVSKR